MKYIAIDIGSSFIKFGLFDLESLHIHSTGKIPTPSRLGRAAASHFELDAGELFHTVEGIIDDCLSSEKSIGGLVLSTQMHGFVLTHPGLPADTYVSWQDTRCLESRPEGGNYLEYLKAAIPPEFMAEAGVPLKPMLGLCNLFTLLAQANLNSLYRPKLYTLGSYVISRLTGRNITHISNAAPLGLVDIRRRTWHGGILRAAGLEILDLPEITDRVVPVGYFERNGNRLAVLPDIGDQQATVLGCAARCGDVVVNVGTASQIANVTDRLIPGDYEIRPYFDSLYLNTVSRMPGGRNIDVIVNFISGIGREIFGRNDGHARVWDYFNNLYKLDDPQDLEVDSSFYDMPHKMAGGKIGNIGPSNLTVPNLFSATLKDMAQVYHRYILELCGSPEPDRKIVFSGGVSWNNPMLLKSVASETGWHVELSPMRDEVFPGLFKLALIGAGKCADVEEANAIRINTDRP